MSEVETQRGVDAANLRDGAGSLITDEVEESDILRDNQSRVIPVPLAAVGRFSATFPANCPSAC